MASKQLENPDITKQPSKTTKTTKRIGKFAVVGATLTLINFVIYTFIALVIIKNNELLWLSTLISTTIVTFITSAMHSKITWKERDPGQYGIHKFFIWNLTISLVIHPTLTWLFSLMIPVYNFAFDLSTKLHFPFNYDFIQSTGAFCFTTLVIMILNYLFYDNFIFGKQHEKS